MLKVILLLGVLLNPFFFFENQKALASFSEDHLKMLRNCTISIISGNKKDIEGLILSENLFNKSQKKIELSHGTGFYYSENPKIPKKIITNFHVIESSILNSSNAVFGCARHGEHQTCTMLEPLMIDKKHDLAMLSSENITCKENLILENEFSESANISTYGNKFGMGLAFFRGIVSAKKMKVSSSEEYHFFDINVSYGNSGAPIFLLNTNKIIGIFKSIYSSGNEIGSAIAFGITAENIKNSITRMENIIEFEKKFDLKIEEVEGKFFLVNVQPLFLQNIEVEPFEELQYIEKNPVKTRIQAIYLFYEFIESEKKEINIVLSSKKKLRSLKLQKIE